LSTPGTAAPLAVSTSVNALFVAFACMGALNHISTAAGSTWVASSSGAVFVSCAPLRVVKEKLALPPSGLPAKSWAPVTLIVYRPPGSRRSLGRKTSVLSSHARSPLTLGAIEKWRSTSAWSMAEVKPMLMVLEALTSLAVCDVGWVPAAVAGSVSAAPVITLLAWIGGSVAMSVETSRTWNSATVGASCVENANRCALPIASPFARRVAAGSTTR
jgi:hypothetical protein